MQAQLISLLAQSLRETMTMVGWSLLFTLIGGLPLGIVLVVTARGHILPHPILSSILGTVVNAARSVPFIILMVAIIPLTRLIAGSSIGTRAAIVPLTLAAIPFAARMFETVLLKVDMGVIEAAQSMGASPWQIVTRVLLPESFGGLILSTAIVAVNLIGYSAMAGVVGGGGLGDLAVRYGFQRFRQDIMLYTVLLLIVVVQSIQAMGDWAARKWVRR